MVSRDDISGVEQHGRMICNCVELTSWPGTLSSRSVSGGLDPVRGPIPAGAFSFLKNPALLPGNSYTAKACRVALRSGSFYTLHHRRIYSRVSSLSRLILVSAAEAGSPVSHSLTRFEEAEAIFRPSAETAKAVIREFCA